MNAIKLIGTKLALFDRELAGASVMFGLVGYPLAWEVTAAGHLLLGVGVYVMASVLLAIGVTVIGAEWILRDTDREEGTSGGTNE